jgi:hypothetical protein
MSNESAEVDLRRQKVLVARGQFRPSFCLLGRMWNFHGGETSEILGGSLMSILEQMLVNEAM